MESAHPLQPKDPSSTLSAVSKDEPNQLTAKQFSCVKEGEAPSETKAGNSEMNSSDKKAVTHTDVCVATAESLSKGPKSKQSPPVPGDIQEKKLAGEQDADMQWRAYHDLGSENYGMPLAVSGYNPYWTGGIPLGVGNYMAPYGMSREEYEARKADLRRKHEMERLNE
ncbi:hypothetical protein B296_00045413, partial [Ensete ventricosum]